MTKFSAPLESPPRDSSEIAMQTRFLVRVLEARDSDGAEICHSELVSESTDYFARLTYKSQMF